MFRFYDINPGVLRIAERDFPFLQNSDATIEVVLATPAFARARAESEFRRARYRRFSSEAIPVHSSRRRRRHLPASHETRRVIAFHVTNRFLNLGAGCRTTRARPWLHVIQIADIPMRRRAAATGCCFGQHHRSTNPTDGSRQGDRGPQGMAAVDRRLQQPFRC